MDDKLRDLALAYTEDALQGLTGGDAREVLRVMHLAGQQAAKRLVEAREVRAMEERITPELVEDAKREGLTLTQYRGVWAADWADAHPYALSEHGPARRWVERWLENH